MKEPDWDELKARLEKMTVKQLRVVTSRWFAGCMGGASAKYEIIQEMVAQMRHWWNLPDNLGKLRVGNVLRTIAKLDGGWAPEREYAYYTIEYGDPKKEGSNA